MHSASCNTLSCSSCCARNGALPRQHAAQAYGTRRCIAPPCCWRRRMLVCPWRRNLTQDGCQLAVLANARCHVVAGGACTVKAHDIDDMQPAELRVQLRRRAIGSSVLPCSHGRAAALLRWVHQSALLMSSSTEATRRCPAAPKRFADVHRGGLLMSSSFKPQA